jgi:hypothetical protein
VRNEEGRVYGSVEQRRRIGPIVQLGDPRLGGEQFPDAASGERAPHFGGEEQRERPTRVQKPERPLDEECGNIDLRREARAGARRGRAA